MPVYKYKNFSQARKALWTFYPDKAYFKQVEDLWKTANKLSPIRYPQGIFKFKNISEANEHRRQYEIYHSKKVQLRNQTKRRSVVND